MTISEILKSISGISENHADIGKNTKTATIPISVSVSWSISLNLASSWSEI